MLIYASFQAEFISSALLRRLTFSLVSSQVSRRQILALPRRALQRAGVAARGPPADRGLPRGQPLSGLRRHRRLNLHQQEVLKHQKDRRRGVSTPPPNHSHLHLFRFLCRHFPVTSSPLRYRQTLAPYAFENTLRVNPVFENDDGVLTQVSTLPYAPSPASSQSQRSEPERYEIENIRLSIEVLCAAARPLRLTTNLKLVAA